MTRRIEGRSGFVHPPPKRHLAKRELTGDMARSLLAAEKACAVAELAAAAARERRDDLRKRYRPRLPSNVQVRVAGVLIKVSPTFSAETFRLKGYREAGHTVTKEMRAFIGGRTPYDVWTVKEGPPK